eukprot:1180080-Prorocentrum_minimum.AAC.4
MSPQVCLNPIPTLKEPPEEKADLARTHTHESFVLLGPGAIPRYRTHTHESFVLPGPGAIPQYRTHTHESFVLLGPGAIPRCQFGDFRSHMGGAFGG